LNNNLVRAIALPLGLPIPLSGDDIRI